MVISFNPPVAACGEHGLPQRAEDAMRFAIVRRHCTAAALVAQG
jgi:hypothetical protein